MDKLVHIKSILINKVLHHNVANTYTIAIGKETSSGNEISIVGNFKCATGEKFNFNGKWVFHKTYGRQFEVHGVEKITDLDELEIRNYLTSFDGIGPSRAKRIVDAFGKNTLNVIKKEHTRLVTIGIPSNIVQKVHNEIVKNDVVNKLVEGLRPYGISLRKINQIYETYHEDSLNILETNPYKLADDISGINFSEVDYIAQDKGIEHDCGFRIYSCIKHALFLASENGHTYLPADELIKKVNAILSFKNQMPVDNNYIMKVMLHMEEYKELIIEEDTAVYLPMYYFAERYAARKLYKIRESKYNIPLNKDLDEIIKEIQDEMGVEYAAKQQDAIKSALTDKVLVITGGPGTGKTTTVNGIIQALLKNEPRTKIELAAPTGRAAKRMEESTGKNAKTIHRMLEYKPFGDELKCGRNEDNPVDADVLIVDEYSMVDIILLDKKLRALENTTKLIIVGDVDQLPSVGAGNVLADLINSDVISVVRLDTIFRQAETSPIVPNATLINEGQMPNLDHKDFTLIEESDENIVAKLIVDEYVRLIKEDGLTLDEVQILSPLKKKTVCGSKSLNDLVQEAINPSVKGRPEVVFGSTSYRIGDKVMQTKNDYEKKCFNGDIGYIIDINKTGQDPIIIAKFDDQEIEFIGREEIMKLELAYACSIHKSQGSECKICLIPAVLSHKKMLKKKLLYTGVTRGKAVVKFFGTKEAIEYSVKNNDEDARYSKFYLRIQR
ncbi:SF1B family DNA helicase RecD2 [Alkaliphilus sp. B6464]|uniref:SF1B family DNA helicase RecD2 n=1 Tax=Alkaliphilus sp. B6464 TaxID=2731219 RepID=UPI001BA7F92D|nr:ATP-dependent RecD-like DNA helicase [Alkaliphilus sp. B6464]QUH21958.1 ATP-dependent RecD-like DNA helicase [Alkaliphilus sp. B6464]